MKKAKKKAVRAPRPASSAVWPDRASASTPGMTVRRQLDYLVWMSEVAEAVGFHGPSELSAWREAVQRAYDGIVDPMVHEHGDPLPPDVPPALRPGTWPDVPAARIQGMTVRHQLTVLRTIAGLSRNQVGAHHQPEDGERWAARVQRAYDAMNHGPAYPMPDTALSSPPVPAVRKAPKATEAVGAGAKKRVASKPAPSRPTSTSKKPARRRR